VPPTMDRPADWRCPNDACVNSRNMVFGTKESCPKCGTRKDAVALTNGTVYGSSSSSVPTESMVLGYRHDVWALQKTVCPNNTKRVLGSMSACPSAGTAMNAKNPGDWQCPNVSCVNNRNAVFASKSRCPMCGEAKPVGARGVGFPMLQQWPPMQQAIQPANSRKPEDWQCPGQDHKSPVTSRHDTCPKGGISNPVDWQRPHTNHQQQDSLDDEMRSLYGRQERLEIWIWDRLLKTPRSAAQWESLQRDYDMLEVPLTTPQVEEGPHDPEGHPPRPQGAHGTPGLKLPLQAYHQEQAAEHMPISRSKRRPSPYGPHGPHDTK
jgi:hypothetical protein